MTITITHSRLEGTLVSGTSRADGTDDLVKAERFRWSRDLDCRYQPRSRDRNADMVTIERLAATLRAAGHDVTVTVDDTPRSVADVEADRAARAEERAERFAGYAANAAGRSDVADKAARQIMDLIPPGQPILVGHHSERRHRRDLDRVRNGWERAADEDRKATHWAGRSEAAEGYRKHREAIPVTLRRIDKLEAEQRGDERELAKARAAGTVPAYVSRLESRMAERAEQIAYWQGHVAAAEAAGLKVWRQEDFTKGDFIRCGGPRWYRVVRVNKRTVSVEHPEYPSRKPQTLPYDKVTGRRSADDTMDEAS